jgi:uncharacterized membrane protein YbhN (UPF0104 family)
VAETRSADLPTTARRDVAEPGSASNADRAFEIVTPARGRWSMLAGFAVSAALLVIVLLQIDQIDFTAALARLGPVPFALATVCYLATYGTVSWRFGRAVGRFVGEPVGLFDVIRTYLPIVLAANLLAHGLSLGAEVARVLFLKRRHGLNVPTGLGMLLADRMVGMGVVAVLAMMSLIMVFWPAPIELRLVTLASFVAVVGVAGAIAMTYAPRLALARRLKTSGEIVGAYVGSPRMVAEQVATACAAMVTLGLAIHFVSRGIGDDVPLGLVFAATPVIYLGAAIPFTYAGWGSREIACIATLAWTGAMSAGDALAVSVTLGVAAFAATLPGLVTLRQGARVNRRR